MSGGSSPLLAFKMGEGGGNENKGVLDRRKINENEWKEGGKI